VCGRSGFRQKTAIELHWEVCGALSRRRYDSEPRELRNGNFHFAYLVYFAVEVFSPQSLDHFIHAALFGFNFDAGAGRLCAGGRHGGRRQ
jgi:hypothetical protein